MESKQLRPVKHRKGVITVECCVTANFGERYFEVLVSIPGHEGVAQAAWPMTNGVLSSPQLSDLCTYIGSMVTASICSPDGAQEVLPL